MVMNTLASIYRFLADVAEVAGEAHRMRDAAAVRYPGLMASE